MYLVCTVHDCTINLYLHYTVFIHTTFELNTMFMTRSIHMYSIHTEKYLLQYILIQKTHIGMHWVEFLTNTHM